MADAVIQTVLTADDTAHRAAFERAAEQVKRHQASVEELRKKSQARANEELRAIQAEVAGRKDQAAAIRELVALKEQAHRLAKESGLSEQATLVLLQKRAAVERQAAADAAAAALERRNALAAEQAAAQAAVQKGRLGSAVGDLRALKLEATGRREEAEALRQSMRLKEQAADLAKQTGQSEAVALRILEQKARLEQQIADQRARAARPIDLRDRPGADLQRMDAWNRAAEQTKRRNEQMGRSGQNAAMGFLELSRAVEDAQYGFRGVMNNLPGMVMAFGGGMGLAGAVSLAAVGIYQLGKAYLSYLDSIDNGKAIKNAAKAGQEAYEAAMKQLEATREQERATRRLLELEGQWASAIQSRLSLQSGVIPRVENEIRLSEEQRRLADELADAKERLAKAQGLPGSPAGSREREELKRLMEDLERQKKLVESAGQEWTRLETEAANFATATSGELDAVNKRLDEVRKSLEFSKAGQKQEMEVHWNTDGAVAANAMRNAKIYYAQVVALKKELAELEANQKSLAKAEADSAAEAKANMDAMSKMQRQAIEERNSIQRRIAQKQELLKVTESLAKVEAEAEKRRLGEAQEKFGSEVEALRLESQGQRERAEALRSEYRMRREAVELAKELGITEEEALRRLQEKDQYMKKIAAAPEEKRQQGARLDLTTELTALALEAKGQKARAEALRTEHALRREAADQAERLGVSEAEALRLLRAREALEKEIERRRRAGAEGSKIARAGSEESKIRQSAQNRRRWKQLDSTNSTEGAFGRWGNRTRGLRESELQGRADLRERTMRIHQEVTAPVMRLYERMATGVEDMNQRLQKLGVY